jgi:predicted transcriptional regulator
MPISVRLKPQLERLLDSACKRERKTRSALVHEALAAFLRPKRANLGDAIAEALATSPRGFGIQRKQPTAAETRDWPA